MGKKLADMSGVRFGKVVAVKKVTFSDPIKYECLCDCGKIYITSLHSLRTGNSKSCGCARGIPKHGMSRTRFYKIWFGMISRCHNPNNTNYHRYGAKGVYVCKRWMNFQNFKEDMLEGYEENLTIDRVKNEYGYEKGNCRWATMVEQAFNKRNNVKLTINGVTKLMRAWADEAGINENTLRYRLRNGWSTEDAVKSPVKKYRYSATTINQNKETQQSN